MSHVRVSRAGAVLTITLDRPEALNALTGAMQHALEEAFDAYVADRDFAFAW